MRIRDEQVRAFCDELMRQFEARMAAHLRSAFPDKLAGTDEADLLGLVRRGTARARGYRIEGESDVTRFLEYTVEYDPDFDTSTDWAPPILTADAGETQKMDALDDLTTFELRD